MKPDGLLGGQLPRVAPARVLAHAPRRAFLDEATGALDIGTERDLLGRLAQALPETTAFVVAHRKPQGPGRLRRIEIGASQGASEAA
jgi:ABC-type uncharacterized transport system fused permease/ATPase subunit